MVASLFFLAAGLQAWAATLAFRRAGRPWSRSLAGPAMLLLAALWILEGLRWADGGPVRALPWLALGASVLLLSSVRALGAFLARQDGVLRSLGEARLQSERVREGLLAEWSEQAQRSAERDVFLKTVVETADVFIAVLDAGMRVRLWNHSAEAISGYGREEVLGRSDILELLCHDSDLRAALREKFDVILHQDVVETLEAAIRAKDGGSRIISWHAKAMRDASGEIGGAVIVGRDVTDARRAEQDLQRVHALQNLILEHNVLGMILVRDGRIEWANPRAAGLFGIPLRELAGAPDGIIYADDAVREEVWRKARPLMAQGVAADSRIQLRRRDGQYFWCRLVGLAVDPANPAAGSVWLAEDINRQVAAESSLQDSEARFRGAFEGTHDALFLMTPDGIFDCNQRALDLFGFAHKSEILRLQLWDLSPSRQPDSASSRLLTMAHVQTVLRTGSDCYPWEHRTQYGELFPAEVLLSTFYMGRRKVIQASVRDLRERLAAEEMARERDRWFRRLFEILPDAMLFLDTRTWRFVDFSQAALDMLRCTREEVADASLESLTPEFLPDGSRSLAKGLEMRALAIQNGIHRFPWVHRSHHREDFRVDVTLASLQPGTSPLLLIRWKELVPEA